MWGSVGAGVRACVGEASARPCLRSAEKALGRNCFRAVREGVGLIAFNARFGTVPLLLGRSVICGQAARVVFGDRLQGVGGVDGFWPPEAARGLPR